MLEPYRILLAEDHIIFRELIKKSLKETDGLEVVGDVSDGLVLLESLETLNPQMVILDISLPSLSGLDAARKIKASHPDIKILMLTMHKSKDHLTQALNLGVDGYLLKEDAFRDLLTAIGMIRGGKPYISKLLFQQALESFLQKPRGKPKDPDSLTPREIEVLKYFGGGKSNKEIASSLLISESTVRIHLKNIKDKLHTKTNVELIRYALKHGYSDLT
jgi:DNA-binding NarL/FixJ family response regulator